MSKNIMQSRHDEYHKLTRGERIGYGMGDFAQNLVFGTIGGFLALHMLTVNTISTARRGLYFCLCASLMFSGIRWSAPMLTKEVQVPGNIVPGF
jgi:hypothetical protein